MGNWQLVGSLPLFLAEHQTPEEIITASRTAESQGQTTMLICDGERVIGYLAVQDEPRPGTKEVLAELKAKGIRTVMLTGDNPGVAERVAEAVGIDQVYAGLLPDEKLNKLTELKQEYGQVVMIVTASTTRPLWHKQISVWLWAVPAMRRCLKPRMWC